MKLRRAAIPVPSLRPICRVIRVAGLVVGLAAGLALRSPTVAHAATPIGAPSVLPPPTALPPPVHGIVVNRSSVAVDGAALDALFQARIGTPRGLDGLLLIQDRCGDDPESALDAGLVEHGAAQRAGEMYNDTVAWLICREPGYTTFTYAVDNPLAGYLDPPSVSAAMADGMATGDVTAAAAAGLSAVAAQLERAPAGLNARPTPVPAPTPALPPDAADEPSIAATLVWVLLGSSALGALHWLNRRRRTADEAGAAPEPPAVRELDAQLALVAQRLVTDSPTLDRVSHALEPLGDRVRVMLLRRHQSMVHRAEALARDAEVVGHLRAAGELPDRGEEGQQRIEGLLVEARALGVYTRQLEREAQRAARLHEGADALLEEAEQAIAAARTSYDALRLASAMDARRLPPGEAAFAVPAAWLAGARDRAAAGAALDAGCRADDAIDLAARILRVARRLRRTEAAVADVRRRHVALHAHAPASWADIVGDGAEAEASLDAAVAGLDVALSAPFADLGADAAAGLAAGLATAAQELARARQLLAAIDARARHLEAAKAAVVEHRAALRAGLTAAQERFSTAPAAVRTGMAAAAEAAQQGDAAADATPPDWASAVERWATAARALGAAAADAPGDSGASDLMDRAVALARIAAHGAVDRADRFVEAHRRDCAPTAVRRTLAAIAQLRDADRERERRAAPAIVAEGYLLAMRTAGAAFDMLAADVRKAERRRVGWLPRGQDVVTVAAMAGVQRIHPFPGRLGPWEPLRTGAAGQRPGAWGALAPGIDGRPTGW